MQLHAEPHAPSWHVQTCKKGGRSTSKHIETILHLRWNADLFLAATACAILSPVDAIAAVELEALAPGQRLQALTARQRAQTIAPAVRIARGVLAVVVITLTFTIASLATASTNVASAVNQVSCVVLSHFTRFELSLTAAAASHSQGAGNSLGHNKHGKHEAWCRWKLHQMERG